MTPARSNPMWSADRLLAMALLGGLALAVGAVIAPERERVWSNLLIITFYLVTLALGGALFIALTCVSGARWNRPFHRVPEALANLLPVAGLGMILVLLLRMQQYGWDAHTNVDPGVFWFKQWWSRPEFWITRAVVYVALWVFFSKSLLAAFRGPKARSPAGHSPLATRLSVLFLIVYALSFSLASCDWFMLLEPMWFSTAWGVYHFAGMIQATLAITVVLSLVLRARGGPLHGVFTDDHLHDLGRLLLGFSCFWMYIWFSQYMLIWYTNMPEETSYYVPRTLGPWGPVMVVSILLNWIAPFFLLLPKPAKRSGSVMMKVAVVVLIGRWIDLYTVVFPATLGTAGADGWEPNPPAFGLWEAAAVICLIGVFGSLFSRSFAGTRSPTHTETALCGDRHG